MSRFVSTILIVALLGMMTLPGQVVAQRANTSYPYTAIDLGTLGGPNAQFGIAGDRLISAGGAVLAQPDTTVRDPDYRQSGGAVNGLFRNISHAALWHNGAWTDLGALPGNNSSAVFGINAHGVAIGASESGSIDHSTGYPREQAVVWTNGTIIRLPTFGGSESAANSINDRGQVVGVTTNAVHDHSPLDSAYPMGTQARAFLWTGSKGMVDLGTLGGPDSDAYYVNNRGMVTGVSFINRKLNVTTGIPTQHVFLWTQATGMRDLGTLGGSVASPSGGGVAFNDRGEVVGSSDLLGDGAFHPFLWNGTRMLDLGTFGGVYGEAIAINQAGHVVGFAQFHAYGGCRAFLWKNGAKINLGLAPGQVSSSANSVNAHDQVVGGVCFGDKSTTDAWLWEHGVIHDLNTLVAPSSLRLNGAYYIDDKGRIVATGVLPNKHMRVVLLVPKGMATSAGLAGGTH